MCRDVLGVVHHLLGTALTQYWLLRAWHRFIWLRCNHRRAGAGKRNRFLGPCRYLRARHLVLGARHCGLGAWCCWLGAWCCGLGTWGWGLRPWGGAVFLLLVTGRMTHRHHGRGAEHDSAPLPCVGRRGGGVVRHGWWLALVLVHGQVQGLGLVHHYGRARAVTSLVHCGRGSCLWEGRHIRSRIV